jgi:hypothetical protein
VLGSAVDATETANQTFSSGFAQGQLSCASTQSNPATCLPPVAIHDSARWKTSRTLLHGVESWPGTSVWIDSKHPRAIRRHPRREPTVSYTSERLPDGLCGLFCSVFLCAIDGSPITVYKPTLLIAVSERQITSVWTIYPEPRSSFPRTPFAPDRRVWLMSRA